MLTDKLHRELDLLQRHIIVLSAVNTSQPIGIMKLSDEIGLPPHKVRYSLRLLEQAGYIGPSTYGAVTLPPGEEFLGNLPNEVSALTEAMNSIRSSLI
jgi:predicted transcriptional regulator